MKSNSNNNKIDQGSTYEIDYDNKSYTLKTSAKTLPALENDIKSTIKLPENTEMIFHYNKNKKFIILDDIEDLENGMIIKASILYSSQPQPQSNSSNFFFP